jgi:hypothetical protein
LCKAHTHRDCPEFKQKQREIRMRGKFGLSQADYDAMLAAQGGVCAICLQTQSPRPLNIDHCHKTGRIRGLLCTPCNSFLGRIKEKSEALARIAAYLKPC